MDRPAPDSRRRLLASVCIATAAATAFFASLPFVSLPMQRAFGAGAEEAALMRAVPFLGALLVIFPAGVIAARVRPQRLVAACGFAVAAGSLAIALATATWMATAGLLVSNIARTVLAVALVGFVTQTFTDKAERNRALAALCIVTPAVYLVVPIVASWAIDSLGWRAVAWSWLAGGVVIAACARGIRPTGKQEKPNAFRPWTAVLGGAALVLVVQTVHAATFQGAAAATLAWAMAAAMAIVALVLVIRAHPPAPGTMSSLRSRALVLPLVALLLSQCSNLWFYAIVMWRYAAGFSMSRVGVFMAPTQLAAVAGAWIASRAIRRWTPAGVGSLFLLAAAAALFASTLESRATSVAMGLAILGMYGAATTGAGVCLTTAIMGASAPGEEFRVSAFRNAANVFGGAVGVTLLSAVVTSAMVSQVAEAAEEYGAGPTTVAAIAEYVREDAPTRDIVNDLDIDEPDASFLRAMRRDAVMSGFRAHGLVGGTAAVAAAAATFLSGRRRAGRA